MRRLRRQRRCRRGRDRPSRRVLQRSAEAGQPQDLPLRVARDRCRHHRYAVPAGSSAPLSEFRCGRSLSNSLAAIPDRPDRRPRPARAEAAAIVATAVKTRPAEIVPVAIVPVIAWDWIDIPGALVAARHAPSRSFPGVGWKAVIRWLLIARQEAVSVPAWRRPFMNRRSRPDDRQQRQEDSNQWKRKARHQRTINGRLLRGDSNLSAQ